jgi:hypothetical protein
MKPNTRFSSTGALVAKLKRGESLELMVNDDVIDLQAKVAYWGSKIERIISYLSKFS